MKSNLIICCLLFVASLLNAQIKYASNDPKYVYSVQQADTALAKGNYQLAFTLLEQALSITDKSQRTLLKHAEAAVQLANYDAAFSSLSKAQDRNWQNFCAYTADQKDLYKAIQDDSRWKSLLAVCEEKQALFTNNLDQALIDTLSRMRERDNAFRNLYTEISTEKGKNSNAYKSAIASQATVDSANVKQLKAIITEKGFPVISKVTLYGSQSALIIIQRANTAYRRNLLPNLQALTESGELRKPDLAFYIDNLLFDEGKKQLYGTRIDLSKVAPRLHPITDPDFVDVRRASMNLSSEKEYLTKLGLPHLWPIKSTKTKKKAVGKKK